MPYPLTQMPTFATFMVKARQDGVVLAHSKPQGAPPFRYLRKGASLPVIVPEGLQEEDRLTITLLYNWCRWLALTPETFGLTLGLPASEGDW